MMGLQKACETDLIGNPEPWLELLDFRVAFTLSLARYGTGICTKKQSMSEVVVNNRGETLAHES